jgi:hypothetical protein
MKSFLLAVCFVLAILACSDASAECEGGSCSLPSRVVAMSSQHVRQTAFTVNRPIRSRAPQAAGSIVQTVKEAAVRPFRRGWFSRRSDRG